MSSAKQFPTFPVPLASHEDVVKDAVLFMETLRSFHFSLASKFTIPVVGRKELNLHVLYVEVTKRGGFEKVVCEKRWKQVSRAFEFSPSVTNVSYMLKKHYLSLLHRYEVVYFRLQSAAPVFSQTDPVQVEGIIDSQFEHGYLVTMKLKNEMVTSVLYHCPDCPGSSSSAQPEPQPCTAVVPYVPDLNQPDGTVVPQPCTALVPYNPDQIPQPAARKGKSTRRRRRAADPDFPKLGRSGYNFFFAEKHAALYASYPNRQTELTSLIAQSWNNLPAEEKMVYQGYGERDRERYQKEMKEYKERLNNMGQQG